MHFLMRSLKGSYIGGGREEGREGRREKKWV